jgi:nicotinate phosphoribosyltransferase
MGVSADAPWLDMAYKLVDYNGRPVLKLSTGKISLPGPKQIFRSTQHQGQLKGDLLGLRDEIHRGAEPLLKKVMENARKVGFLPSLKEIRANFLEELGHLDDRHKSIRSPALYPVELSPRLKRLQEEIQDKISRTQLDD